MTIDLKWGLPFVLPFALLLMARGLAWVAGIEWADGDGVQTVAWLSGLTGLFFGTLAVALMFETGIHWNITIGGRK